MTATVNVLFDRHDVNLQADSIANFLPPGIMFEGGKIEGTNLRKLLTGLSNELFRSEDLLKQFTEEFLPDCTVLFLDEWESALGIPDDCFLGTGNNDERRRDILTKLASLGIQTAKDFEDLAAIFGIDVTVESGGSPGVGNIFPLEFPILIFFNSAKEARFTIVVTFIVQAANKFPLEFPILFGNNLIALLECLFRKLKPANCDIIFRQV